MSLSYRENVLLKVNSSDTTRPDFAGSYTVTVYPVGAIVRTTQDSTTINVDAGHSFRAGDKLLIKPGSSNTFSGTDTVQSVTATTILMTQSYSVAVGDAILNLGPDTGTSTPAYDGSPLQIFSDGDGSTVISSSRVTASAAGEYTYYHKGDGKFWELVRDGSGDVSDVVKGFGGVPGRHNVVDYGAAVDNSTNDVKRVQAASDAAAVNGESVFFPHGTCLIDKTVGIVCSSGVTYEGQGTVKYSTGTVTAALFSINALSNVEIRGLTIHGNSNSQQFGNIQIEGASTNITVSGCLLDTGYSGVWVKQGSGIRILDNLVRNQSHPIYLGENEHPGGGAIEGVLIQGNECSSTVASSDGIKFVKTVTNASVVNNWLHDNQADGIDLFVSGEYTTITGNVIEGNGVNGLDLKSNDSLFTVADWGKNRRCTITGNIIRDNAETGIKLWKQSATDTTYWHIISANVVTGNAQYGILTQAPYCVISSNIVTGNATNTGTTYSGIFVTSPSGTTSYVVVSKNVVVNNGSTSQFNYGINLGSCSSILVDGNILDLDSNAPNGTGTTQDGGINIGATCSAVTCINNIIGPGIVTTIVDAASDTTLINNYGESAWFINQTMQIVQKSLAVSGSLGTITLVGGSSNGHKITMSRTSQNFIEASGVGGSLVFRANADTANVLIAQADGVQIKTTAGITASTTQTQGQGALTASVNQVSTCANANDTVTLPSAAAGLICIVINDGAQTLQVFPASGDNLGAGVNTSTTIVAGSFKEFVAYDTTNWQDIS